MYLKLNHDQNYGSAYWARLGGGGGGVVGEPMINRSNVSRLPSASHASLGHSSKEQIEFPKIPHQDVHTCTQHPYIPTSVCLHTYIHTHIHTYVRTYARNYTRAYMVVVVSINRKTHYTSPSTEVLNMGSSKKGSPVVGKPGRRSSFQPLPDPSFHLIFHVSVTSYMKRDL